jgi:hypothetical protein
MQVAECRNRQCLRSFAWVTPRNENRQFRFGPSLDQLLDLLGRQILALPQLGIGETWCFSSD